MSRCTCGWEYPKAVGAVKEADASKYADKLDNPVADKDLVKGLTFVIVCPRCATAVMFVGTIQGAFAS